MSPSNRPHKTTYPDQNGVELYWDRPKEHWPRKPQGELAMYTRPLNLENLLWETANLRNDEIRMPRPP